MNFEEFDKKVNSEQLQKDIATASENVGEYEAVPAGEYVVKIENMKVGFTKETKEPCFKVMCRIVEGERKKQCIFFNRKIYGNKESDKWNDGKAIATVTGWLAKLETEVAPVFESYSQFAECVLDIFEECEEYKLTLAVDYDPEEFNPISIKEVYEG